MNKNLTYKTKRSCRCSTQNVQINKQDTHTHKDRYQAVCLFRIPLKAIKRF